jgi:hypothetical protein
MRRDSGHLSAGKNRDGMLNWQEALAWAEGLDYAGHSDWRLPNVKELQSIVDYSRSPATSRSAAMDPIFEVTPITDERGEADYPFYWSSTTHASLHSGDSACYVAFGRSPGWLPNIRGEYTLLDVHGAGSQRSDPKAGDPEQFPRGRGPQGDVIRIDSFVRAVRGGEASPRSEGPRVEMSRGQAARESSPREPPGFVRRLDRNGDGRVSRSEFDGPAGHFDHLDRDRDGYLSEQEAPRGPPPGHPPGGFLRRP